MSKSSSHESLDWAAWREVVGFWVFLDMSLFSYSRLANSEKSGGSRFESTNSLRMECVVLSICSVML